MRLHWSVSVVQRRIDVVSSINVQGGRAICWLGLVQLEVEGFLGFSAV
jgi:hypothetical protein